MSINTYAELKQAIANELHRDDLTTVIPQFIALAEADIQQTVNDLPWLFERATATTAPGNALIDVTGMVTLVDAWIDGEHVHMGYPSQVPTSSTSPGKPTIITLQGVNKIRVHPVPDQAYDLDILYSPVISPSLADGEPAGDSTNWILQQHKACYLYGSLLYAAAHIHDDNRAGIWRSLHEHGMQQLRTMQRIQPRMTSGLTGVVNNDSWGGIIHG